MRTILLYYDFPSIINVSISRYTKCLSVYSICLQALAAPGLKPVCIHNVCVCLCARTCLVQAI
jgi:hypothetical protein